MSISIRCERGRKLRAGDEFAGSIGEDFDDSLFGGIGEIDFDLLTVAGSKECANRVLEVLFPLDDDVGGEEGAFPRISWTSEMLNPFLFIREDCTACLRGKFVDFLVW